MPKSNKTVFSKLDLYHLMDQMIQMYDKMYLAYNFAKMENDEIKMRAYDGVMFELNLLISAYGMREKVKIN